MGVKVNYNSKNNKKLKKYIKIAGIVILGIFIIYIVIQSTIRAYRETVSQDTGTASLHYEVKDYESLKDILNAHGCSYISEDRTTELLTIYVKFDRDLYTGETSNESFFDNLIKVIADFENHCNFELIDETRGIDILVTCENSAITEIKINGDENYYLNQDSKLNETKEKTAVTEFSIDSEEILKMINSNWNPTNVSLGSKESICNGYQIYFDEGFEYKVSGRTVYNFIFTEKYKKSVAQGLNASSTAEEVKDALGDPTFTTGSGLYGYLGEKIYLFFDFTNKEVSIYPVMSLENEDEFVNLISQMNESSDIKQFAMNITSLWTDYDIYDYDSNYVDLQYTLRGVQLSISSNSLKNGLYIYQNYDGDISKISGLDNVYIQNKDLVFSEECKRANNEYLNRHIEGAFSEEELKEFGAKFNVVAGGKLSNGETGYKGVQIYSRDKEYADSELDKTLVISSYEWYDDYNLIYSIDNDGIYVYNCANRENNKIADISGNIMINSAGDGKIIYNDTEEIDVE